MWARLESILHVVNKGSLFWEIDIKRGSMYTCSSRHPLNMSFYSHVIGNDGKIRYPWMYDFAFTSISIYLHCRYCSTWLNRMIFNEFCDFASVQSFNPEPTNICMKLSELCKCTSMPNEWFSREGAVSWTNVAKYAQRYCLMLKVVSKQER